MGDINGNITPPADSMGERFKQFRMSIEKSKGELAQELKCTVKLICHIEEGKLPPPTAHLVTLASTYGMDINWLISGIRLPHGMGEKKRTPHPEILKALCRKKQIPLKDTYDDLIEMLQVPEVAESMEAAYNHIKRSLKDEIEQSLNKGKIKRPKRA